MQNGRWSVGLLNIWCGKIPDAEALEDRSTRSVDMHGRGDDLEACAMDATDIRDDERVGALTLEAPNNEILRCSGIGDGCCY